MNIAIYQPRVSYFVGGGEVVPLQHAKFFSYSGHQVTIITTRAFFIKPSEYFLNFLKNNPKITIRYIDLPLNLKWIYNENPGKRWIRWDYESFYVGRLASTYFLKNKFDIIAVHYYLDTIVVPPGRKLVLHLHGYPLKSNYMHKLFTLIPTSFISVSLLIKIKWQELVDIKKIYIATNGIDSDYFSPDEKTSIKYDIIYVGRLIKIKGIFYLIEAIDKLKKIPLRVAIVGTGPEFKNLQKLVNKKNLNNKVKFLGYVKDIDLPKIYQSSLMGVFPSYAKEGILTTMLEAAACGKPTITTTACSMSEFLKDNYNGLLVKPQNSKELATAIKKLYQDKKMAYRLGKQARKSIESFWSWKKKIKQVEKIYAKILNNN